MLPVKLHIVIGRTQTAEIWSKIPEYVLLNRIIPIRFPTERYKGTKSMLINIEILIEFEMFFSIEE